MKMIDFIVDAIRVALPAALLLWSICWIVATFHFGGKFNAIHSQFTAAEERGDIPQMKTYLSAMELAHDDTGSAMWPPVWLERWNADYVAEARAGKR